MHIVLIAAHALCGTLALVTGCLVLRPPRPPRSVLFRVYLIALIAMVGLMLAVVAYDWSVLEPGQRITFAALCALGVFTGWRGCRAYRELAARSPGWSPRYIDHVGFTVISLFDGFAIVAAIDLGAPLPWVVAVGALGVIVGVVATNAVKSRMRLAGLRS